MLNSAEIGYLKRRIGGRHEGISRLFGIFSDATRLKIVEALSLEPELCVSDLAELLGMTPPAISHHLRQMKDLGLVTDHRMGQEVCYQLSEHPVTRFVHKSLQHEA